MRDDEEMRLAAPTFSIIMPAHNSAGTIGAAIESVLVQTRSDFELIVVDDGSTDTTADRVKPYLRDSRVRMLSQNNLGLAVSRNTAITVARGTFVSLLDSDDLWLPRYLESMAATLDDEPSAAVIYTDAWVLDDKTRRIARTTAMSPWHPPTVPTEPEQFLRALLEFGNFVFVGATIRRATLLDVGLFRVGVQGVEDYELWLRIAAHGYGFARSPRKLALYRQRPGQMSSEGVKMARAYHEVLRIVAEEYDVTDDVRELARLTLEREKASGSILPPKRQRIPFPLRRPYAVLSRVRHFYLRPPMDVRKAFPNLRSL